jgi:hypothetical protein
VCYPRLRTKEVLSMLLSDPTRPTECTNSAEPFSRAETDGGREVCLCALSRQYERWCVTLLTLLILRTLPTLLTRFLGRLQSSHHGVHKELMAYLRGDPTNPTNPTLLNLLTVLTQLTLLTLLSLLTPLTLLPPLILLTLVTLQPFRAEWDAKHKTEVWGDAEIKPLAVKVHTNRTSTERWRERFKFPFLFAFPLHACFIGARERGFVGEGRMEKGGAGGHQTR